VTPIPESPFTGRTNTLFAYDIDVEVYGDAFLPAYTDGDNSQVVATDSMKNFIHRHAVAYDGATLEGFLEFLGRQFLTTYAQMGWVRVRGREIPFHASPVPGEGGHFSASPVLFSHGRSEHATAEIDVHRVGDGTGVIALQAGMVDLHLIKVTGSAFARFVRDGFTTLEERIDRPLYIFLDIRWKYTDAYDAINPSHVRYVAAEQVRDLCAVTFHDFVSMSIQHLIWEMGKRLLARFPQLASISFEAQNRLWDVVVRADDGTKAASYCDPRPPYGSLALVIHRDDIAGH
jgi:urate oxidase